MRTFSPEDETLERGEAHALNATESNATALSTLLSTPYLRGGACQKTKLLLQEDADEYVGRDVLVFRLVATDLIAHTFCDRAHAPTHTHFNS